MKKQIKTLRLNKTKVSELSAINLRELKGGKSGDVANCPTVPLCFSRPDRDDNCGISINNCSVFVICTTIG